MTDNKTKLKWQPPQLIDVAALPQALGYCTTGNSQRAGCQNGAAPTTTGGCSSGTGRAIGSCTSGTAPTNQECRTGTAA
jgi:hypothetical protein